MACYLLGHPLGQSFAAELFTFLGCPDYRLHEITTGRELDDFVKRGDYEGLSVTLPFKHRTARLMDRLTRRARETGTVNTVVRTRDGRLLGDNTDVTGIGRMFSDIGADPSDRSVLILGSGGAARSAAWYAREHGARTVRFVSRLGRINYDNVYELCGDAELLINATPVGMYPAVDQRPLDLARFQALRGVMDCVYNPLRTLLVQQAHGLGIPAAGGLRMLTETAAQSQELFFGRGIDQPARQAAFREMARSRLNVVLIGLPGCGKTTIGEIVARSLGRPFFDTDRMVVSDSGMEIPEIYERFGESGFSDREKQAVRLASVHSGAVIAVGSGAPLSQENVQALRLNGRVYWIERHGLIGRAEEAPLTGSARVLRRMLSDRAPSYQRLADCHIDNERSPASCAQAIMDDLNSGLLV